ncbi:Peroxisomal biogenesis factor 3 [Choanephora cucurbitarum]|uniref:Peroxisomal biogenesis factor 3 n=1 Tax=Choanephora cucurbitarum TaxID=101091 RepID=A0A1C7N197_9FUNG|nr:Peroxisomal biogenesis factor 3 [Choanephora cucurbitarum]
MTILTSAKDYIKRHRRGILVTATIAAGGYFTGKYAAGKIRDLQDKAAAERLAKENGKNSTWYSLKRRFQQNQNDCVFTVLSLLPTLGDQILKEWDIERGWAKLQESRKLEKIEAKLRKEREMAASLQQQQELTEQSTEPLAEENDTKTPVDSSVSSLATSLTIEPEEDRPLPDGILNKKEKHALWEEIKTKSFTRSLTSIYSITLLTLLTHIQLNLLGRFTYIWSVSVLNRSEPTIRLQQEEEEPDVGFLDPEIERMFLSASWWLLHRGWKGLADRVQEAVDEHVASIPLKSTLDYQEAVSLLDKLRHSIEHGSDGKPINYRAWMLPDTEEQELEFIQGAGFQGFPKTNTSTISLRKLLDETKDFIDSPDFSQVLSSCLDEVFGIFDHRAFVSSLLPQNEPVIPSITEVTASESYSLEHAKKVSLANLLPTIGRQAHLAIAGNEYLNAFAYIKDLQAFSALIYTQYGDEVHQEE